MVVNDMTVCGNKLSGVCGASCTFFNICRNNEIANLPKSNIEWMREASLEELAELFGRIAENAYQCGQNGKTNKCVNRNHCTGYCDYGWGEWLKQPHTEKE